MKWRLLSWFITRTGKRGAKILLENNSDTAIQPNNVKDRYVITFFQEGKKKVIGHLPLKKSEKFAKTTVLSKSS